MAMLFSTNETAMTMRALRRGLGLMLCAALVMPLWGCDEDDFLDDDETTVRFLHDVESTGPVDIFVDDLVVARLAPGEFSELLSFDEGQVAVTVRTVNGELLVRDPAVVLVENQPAFVTVTGASSAQASLVVIDAPPPVTIELGFAALEVVNLIDDDIELDVYVDDRLIASNLAPGAITTFVAVDVDAQSVEVFDAGANPDFDTPLFGTSLELIEGRSALVVLTDALIPGAEPQFQARVVPLP